MDLEGLVAEYGYLAVLVGTFLEGESILVIAGFAARRGLLELPTVMLCAFAGSLVSDQLAFFIGRRWGTRWIERSATRKARFERARALVDRHQVLMTLTFRFLYGLRNVIPFALGMSRMRAGTYVVLNVVGAAVWAVALAAGGYALGHAFETVMANFKVAGKWGLIGLCAAAFLFWAWSRWRFRRRARAGQGGAVAPAPPPAGSQPPSAA